MFSLLWFFFSFEMKNIFYTISKIRKVGMLQDDSYLYKVTTKK
jgi:hypothetical protein